MVTPVNPTPYKTEAGSFREGVETEHFRTFKQDVELEGKKLTVTVFYLKTTEISLEKAQNDMEVQIGKMVHLASELGLGKEGLTKIKLTGSEVIGKWDKVNKNFEQKLTEDLHNAQPLSKEATVLKHKLDVIRSVTNIYTKAIPSEKTEKTSAKEREFFTEFNSALRVCSNLETIEKLKLSNLLEASSELYEKLDTAKPEELASLRTEMNKHSLELKEHAENLQRADSLQLEKHLVKLTTLYNNTDPERKALKEEMLSKIQELNSISAHTSLTTNAFTATRSNVMNFQAVLEKKLMLMERKAEDGVGANELEKITKSLNQAPTSQEMQKTHDALQGELKKTNINVVSIEEAKQAHRAHPELKWGASHLNFALTTPANWTEVRSALIKSSRSGKLHVTVNVNTPLNIGEKGGVPAGLRSNSAYQERAANLMVTNTYILSSSGEKIGEQISFRGGQFPTKEAAKEALIQIMEHMPEGKLEELHINALLTPIFFTSLKEDKLLLSTHKESLQEALKELIQVPKYKESIEKLQDHIALSNFGVNEGAVGELRVLGMRAQLGWHTSIGDYSNDASQKLNGSVQRKFANMEGKLESGDESLYDDLDRLGAILQVGQEMEAVWAQNDYAEAAVGNNQFKLPSLWKTMDNLIGVTCYTDCMSGKDRTGKVESNAQEYTDEIHMNIADHKEVLSKKFDSLRAGLNEDQLEAWNTMKKTLTSACFLERDLDRMHGLLKLNHLGFEHNVEQLVMDKIGMVKKGLGLNEPKGFMQSKDNIPREFYKQGVDGIPTNTPKITVHGSLQQQFPKLAVSSMYGNAKIDFSKMTIGELSSLRLSLADHQREAQNRRLSQLSGSLQVTEINTSKPGFKVEGGEPLARFSSGFDRDYVIAGLMLADPKDSKFFVELDKAAGLHEVDPSTRSAFHSEIHNIATKKLSQEDKVTRWTQVLARIEDSKMESMAPKAKVAA